VREEMRKALLDRDFSNGPRSVEGMELSPKARQRGWLWSSRVREIAKRSGYDSDVKSGAAAGTHGAVHQEGAKRE
jgi:hypothetical protein